MPEPREAETQRPTAAPTGRSTIAGGVDVYKLTQAHAEAPAAATVGIPTAGAGGAGAEAEWTPGTILCERYRIVTRLGAGGMGVVYRADDLMLRQPVALKFLSLQLVSDEEKLAALANEVRAGWKISHPNVCRIYTMERTEVPPSEEGGRPTRLLFLVMEFIAGTNLDDILRHSKLTRDRALAIAQDICAGLSAVHEQEMLHRDLKPSNIMVDLRGRGRLMDFGVAALAADASREGLVGTPGYLSPEALHGGSATVQSDIYALGLVLYELFAGEPVFKAVDVPTQIKEVKALDAPRLEAMAKIDAQERRLILRCLRENPAERPQSVAEVSGTLFEAAQRGLRTRTLLIGLVATLAVLLVQMTGFFAPAERAAYDLRAKTQLFAPRPTDKIEHIDIDDGSLAAVGHWPWPHYLLGEMVGEIKRAGTKVIAFDVDFPDADRHAPMQEPDGSWTVVDADKLFAADIARAGNVIVPIAVPDPPDDKLQLIVPELALAAKNYANVSFTRLYDGVARRAPMVTPYRGDLVPQLGLAMAAAYIGADARMARVENGRVYLPRNGGGELEIPTYAAPYDLAGDLGPCLDIPWFGGSDWQLMYDPQRKEHKQHMPISQVWDVSHAIGEMRENDYAAKADIDDVLKLLASGNQYADWRKRVDQKALPAFDDGEAWAGLITKAIAAEDPAMRSGLLNATGLGPDEKKIVDTVKNLDQRAGLNASGLKIVNDSRALLHDRLAGKAVLIGATATSMGDFVRTPLSLVCPGSVVHGVIFNAIISGYYWRPMPRWMNLALMALMGLSVTAALAFLPLPVGVGLAIVIGLGWVLVNALVLFDLNHVTADVVGPVVMTALVAAACGITRMTALLRRAIARFAGSGR